MGTTTELIQGIREHLGQFSLHVLLVFATGLTMGAESQRSDHARGIAGPVLPQSVRGHGR